MYGKEVFLIRSFLITWFGCKGLLVSVAASAGRWIKLAKRLIGNIHRTWFWRLYQPATSSIWYGSISCHFKAYQNKESYKGRGKRERKRERFEPSSSLWGSGGVREEERAGGTGSGRERERGRAIIMVIFIETERVRRKTYLADLIVIVWYCHRISQGQIASEIKVSKGEGEKWSKDEWKGMIRQAL